MVEANSLVLVAEAEQEVIPATEDKVNMHNKAMVGEHQVVLVAEAAVALADILVDQEVPEVEELMFLAKVPAVWEARHQIIINLKEAKEDLMEWQDLHQILVQSVQ
jgi:hypothetical protein